MAPPRATPAQRSGRGLEQRQHRAFERGRQASPSLPRALLVGLREGERAGPVRSHDPVHAGARAKQHAGHFARGPARSAQEQQMQGQQVSIPGAPQFGSHAGLLGKGNLHYRGSRHANSSLLDPKISQLLIYQRVRHCANLFRSDLERGR
jgi:hypothetical protein